MSLWDVQGCGPEASGSGFHILPSFSPLLVEVSGHCRALTISPFCLLWLCRNSIPASAVCVFNLSAISQAFNGPFKYQENSRSAWLPYPNPNPNFQVTLGGWVLWGTPRRKL